MRPNLLRVYMRCLRVYVMIGMLWMAMTMTAKIDPAWTYDEIYHANTAASYPLMTDVEKEVVLYYNLARLYPQKFVQVELSKEKKTPFVESLINELNALKPLPAFLIDDELTEFAQCWATVSGQRGITSHTRVECPDGNFAENLSFGVATGRDIVIDLLVDEDDTNMGSHLGHRRNGLDKDYRSIGVGCYTHTKYRYCSVQDFNFDEGSFYPMDDVVVDAGTEDPVYKPVSDPVSNPVYKTVGQPTEVVVVKKTTETVTEKKHVQEQPVQKPAETVVQQKKETRSSKWLAPFFNHSGRHSLSVLSVGYTYSFMDGYHLVNAALLDFRTTLFGMSLLNVEMSVSPFTKRFAYRPQVRLYLPIIKNLSVVPYGGAEIDASRLGWYIDKNYQYDADSQFYINAIGGLALHLTAARHVPMEVKMEYRHPVYTRSAGTYTSAGFYIGAQIYFTQPYKYKTK